MSAERFDLVSAREGRDGKTYWTKLGIMVPSKNGGWSLKFDALPLPNREGDVWVQAFEPKDFDDGPRRGNGGAAAGRDRGGAAARKRAPISEEIDDDIPF